ncbi:MAG TPA: hypothetical protein DIW43_11020 [Spongiibacteraceae bacterium]|nr:hypothetical protein [Spongiibacteraceae bacterium]HCS27977.1 hypothetical protein [Spongiibacteraceae bacterium]|tara:strand:- start:99 stop:299 length:201 start_codon:yes stop_codon:yes gene_type:complete
MPQYQCKDCSFSGKRFKQGRCPACGSANIASGTAKEEDKPRGPLGLLICSALWIYLAFAIWQRYTG